MMSWIPFTVPPFHPSESVTMLPLPEKTPILLLKWTSKAQENLENAVVMVKKELEKNRIILIPSPASDTLLLTASQKDLEEQAEFENFVMERRLSPTETVMDHFTVQRRQEFKKSQNLSGLDADGIFSVHDRCHLVLGLLERIAIGDPKLTQLLSEQTDKATTTNLRYLLQSHEWIEVLTPLHVDEEKLKVQQMTWYPLWHLMPPIDKIQEYYGPEVAYYFTFMGFLGRWLGCLGILGMSCFLFRLYRNDTIDEDEYTPFYGILCFVWAVLLNRFWERKEHVMSYEWGTMEISNTADDFDQAYNVNSGKNRRPEFEGSRRTSPVTGEPELYYPSYRRKLQYLVSALVTCVMLGIAFFIMILSLNLQGYIRPRHQYHPFYYVDFALLSEEGALFDTKSSWRGYIPVIAHVVCILTLNTIYRGVARKLTDWENHETKTAFENSLILKRFLFEAFDCYVVLFYLAFYERDVERLRSELVSVFNIDSFRRLAMEVIVPMLLHYRAGKDTEHPHDLHLDVYEPFDDYMEILIQFGYVTLFASAYPLASLIMCGAVWMEIRSDIFKLTHLCQKPAGERVNNIGMWKNLLQFMAWFCCLTNCLLFGFTSDQMMHYVPDFYIRDGEGVTHMVQDKGWIAILIIFGLERALIYSGLALSAMISVIPEDLAIRLQRRRYLLSKQAKKIG